MPLHLYEKEKILDACFSVFVRHGYSNTTTAFLAEAAGISKALIFHHFKSKKKLYINVLERCFGKMAMEMNSRPPSVNGDFFQMKEKDGMSKVEYFRMNPHMGKFMYEAFFETPDELKPDIGDFKIRLENEYGDSKRAEEERKRRLFDQLSLKEGFDSDEAYELIDIVSEHFRKKLAEDLTDMDKLSDENYWEDFFGKKQRYINMVRYGIEREKRG